MTNLNVSLFPASFLHTKAVGIAEGEVKLSGLLKDKIHVALGEGPDKLARKVLVEAGLDHPETNPVFNMWGRTKPMDADPELALDIAVLRISKVIGKSKTVNLIVPSRSATAEWFKPIRDGIAKRLAKTVELVVIPVE